MKANTKDCNRKKIDAFLDSDRFGIDDNELTDHLSRCEDCRSYMESRAADTGTWSDAADLLAPSSFDNATTVEFSAAFPGPPKVEQTTLIRQVLKTLAPTDDPHRLGRIGEYEVTGVIGAGGMGVVLKAVDPSLDRVVAIKVMSPYLAHHGTARKRFEREAKAAAAVLHPNVIPIHSVYGGDPVPYLVMAYIRGGSLQKRLDREGPLPTTDILRIGSQIAAGLAAAHEQGLIHRDIKPENILLEEGVERVTITDFGLARAVDDSSVTQTGVISGTPRYMSPEQARGDSLDRQSDLFSLGSVLYTLCTGRPPFRADTSIGVMRRIGEETPNPIREINADIPDWLALIVEKLMAKDKADRYASAKEVHTLLESCLSHVQQPTLTDLPASLRERQGPTKPRRGFLPFLTSKHGVFTMIGLLTAGALTLAMTSLTGQDPNPPNTQQVQEEVVNDLDLIQGDWELFSVTDNGQIQPTHHAGRIHIKANVMSFIDQDGKQTEALPFEIDSTKDPKQIDFIDYKSGADDLYLGIYEIEEDTLKICLIEQVGEGDPVERPTKFESPKDSKIILMELRRQADEEPDLPDELKPAQGMWLVTRDVENDRPFVENAIAYLSISNDEFTLFEFRKGGDISKPRMTAKIDPSKSPMTIDLYDSEGNLQMLGIFETQRRDMKLCVVKAGGDNVRPTGFVPPVGKGVRLMELRRIGDAVTDAKPPVEDDPNEKPQG